MKLFTFYLIYNNLYRFRYLEISNAHGAFLNLVKYT